MPHDLVTALRRGVRGTVHDGPRRRAEYSSDASNYRVLPQVVVVPVDADDVAAVLEVGRSVGGGGDVPRRRDLDRRQRRRRRDRARL